MQTQDEFIMIQPSDSRWMDFIQSCPDANIFHHPAWMNMISMCYGFDSSIFAIVDRKGDIQAGLPFMKVHSPISGPRWISLPFSDYCKPLYHDAHSGEELSRQLVRVYQNNRLSELEVRWSLPDCEGIHKVSEFVLHTLKLIPDPDQIARQFKRTHLQNIHTAEERGVKVDFGDGLDHIKIFYDLQLETRRRHGVPAQPWKFFKLLWQDIVKQGLGFVLLARKDDEFIAGMIYIGWGKTLIAKYAASREDRFNFRPNNLLFWEGIRWGCRNGYEVFDMGRTELENTGLRNFKSRWGAVEEPIYYSKISSRPHHPSNNRLNHILHYVITRSPIWVCKLAGELLYKYAG
jgi:lipid II:glycine glycyltransferase (peptidoglycan interpeptide bridge formation enzyme)